MCNDVYAKNTKTGDSFEPDTDGYTKWGMVGLSCTNMRMMARAMYDAGPKLTQQSFVNALRKLPADPIGGIGGAPVVVFIDGKTTPTTRVREHHELPVRAPGAARGDDLPDPGEHQGAHGQALTEPFPFLRRVEAGGGQRSLLMISSPWRLRLSIFSCSVSGSVSSP